MERLRQDNTEFAKVFNEANDVMVEAVGVEIARPRATKGRNTHRGAAGVSTSETDKADDSAEAYYRRNLFAPALDHLLVDLRERFGKRQRQSMTLICLVSSRVPDARWADIQPAWEMYGHLIPVSQRQAEAELIVWRGMCARMSREDRPVTAIGSLGRCPVDAFPAISCLLKILATPSVSTAEAERVFSKVDRTLTAIRSTMRENRLEALILIQSFREEPSETTAVVNPFLKEPGKRAAKVSSLSCWDLLSNFPLLSLKTVRSIISDLVQTTVWLWFIMHFYYILNSHA